MSERDGDREVLRNLAGYGSDLSKPHHTVHYLYFKSEASAQAAAAELRAAGYDKVRVERAPAPLLKRLFGPKEFSCLAETHAVPSEEAVFETTDRLNELAARHGGHYDGWDAGIVK
jgi:hypothetical protein